MLDAASVLLCKHCLCRWVEILKLQNSHKFNNNTTQLMRIWTSKSVGTTSASVSSLLCYNYCNMVRHVHNDSLQSFDEAFHSPTQEPLSTHMQILDQSLSLRGTNMRPSSEGLPESHVLWRFWMEVEKRYSPSGLLLHGGIARRIRAIIVHAFLSPMRECHKSEAPGAPTLACHQ